MTMALDLRTRYLGLDLAHPFLPGASPLVDDLAVVDRLAAAGAPAIVMHSLFEEQIEGERAALDRGLGAHRDAFAEAQSFFPRPREFALGPAEYLEQIRRIKAKTGLPVIG